jgi:hypothetical protein
MAEQIICRNMHLALVIFGLVALIEIVAIVDLGFFRGRKARTDSDTANTGKTSCYGSIIGFGAREKPGFVRDKLYERGKRHCISKNTSDRSPATFRNDNRP